MFVASTRWVRAAVAGANAGEQMVAAAALRGMGVVALRKWV